MRAHLTASQQRYRKRLTGQQAEYLPRAGKPRRQSDLEAGTSIDSMPDTTDYTSRFAIDPAAAAAMGTDELRHNFHIGGLFEPGRISLTYTHYDRHDRRRRDAGRRAA